MHFTHPNIHTVPSISLAHSIHIRSSEQGTALTYIYAPICNVFLYLDIKATSNNSQSSYILHMVSLRVC